MTPDNTKSPVHKPDLFPGANDETRTRYLHLGKVALYQMSYIRIMRVNFMSEQELL